MYIQGTIGHVKDYPKMHYFGIPRNDDDSLYYDLNGVFL